VRYESQSSKSEQAATESPSTKAAPDVVGTADTTDVHLQDFFDCVRSRKQPNCPFELGFRSAIACRMALTAYREGRRVTWDAEREEIV